MNKYLFKMLIISLVFFLALSVIGFGVCDKVFAEKVKIEFLQWWGAEMPEFDEIISQFNEEHPEIEVVPLTVPFSQMRQQIISTHSVGQIADVIGLNMPWTQEFIEFGILEPLEDYLINEKTLNVNNLVQAPMEKINGHSWMVPVTAHPFLFYFNKTLFKEAGLEPKAPKTWDELKDYAIKLTKPEKNQYGYSICMSLQGACNGPIIEMYPLLYTASGRTVKNGKPNLTSPEVIETLEYINELESLGVIAPGTLSKQEQQKIEEFANGRVAMMIDSMPIITVLQTKSPDLDFGVAPVPIKIKMAARNHGWEIGIARKSKNKEAAWTFISWLVSAKINGKFAEEAGQLPGNLASTADFIENNPLIKQAKYIMENSEMVEELRKTPKATDTWRALTVEMQSMLSGKQSAEEAAKKVQEKWEKIFNE